MGSVNTSVSLRLPPGAGSKRAVGASAATSSATATGGAAAAAAAAAIAAAAAAAAPNNKNSNSVGGRQFIADHNDYHLQLNHLHQGAIGEHGDSGRGLKPLTNGRGKFTLVKRGGIISNGGKMVATSTSTSSSSSPSTTTTTTTTTNGGSDNALDKALSENSGHGREIYAPPTLFNGAGGTASVTAIVPTTTRITASHPAATTSTISAFSNNNNRLKTNNSSSNGNGNGNGNNNNNSNSSNRNNSSSNSNNQNNPNSSTKPNTNKATSGVMLAPSKKLTGSKTTIIIGRVNSQQSREINGNHNYSLTRDITKPSTISTAPKMALIGNSASSNSSMSNPAKTTAGETTSTTTPPSQSPTGAATAAASMRISSTPVTAKSLQSAAVTSNAVSTTEDEEDDGHKQGSGVASTTVVPVSRLRLTSDSHPSRGIGAGGGLTKSTLFSPSSTQTSAAAAAATTTASTTVPGAMPTNDTANTLTLTNSGEVARLAMLTSEETEIAKRKDELPSSSNFVGRFSADPGHIFAVDCEAQLRKLHELNRKNDSVSQRIHRIQTKSTVEVAYSELKQVIAQGQEIFKMPCLTDKSNQIAGPLANKEKSTAPLQRKLSESDSAKLVRGCGIHSTLIANTEKLCDSSATESSSEEEDLPEKVEIFNGRKILTPFQYASNYPSYGSQHPAWRWACERASLGAQWTWLQAQVSELEYRIRQQHELCRQLRLRKEPCLQPPEPNTASEDHSRCARTTPLNKNFTKRRLVDAHTISAEAAESVPLDALSLSCECGTMYPQVELCVRCTLLHAQSARERLDISDERQKQGFHLTRQLMAPPWDSQTETSRMAVYDETYHPVLSGKHDISLSLHYENLLRMGYSLLVHKNAMAENAGSETTTAGSGAGAGASAAVSAAVAAKKKRDQQLTGTTSQQHVMQLLQHRSGATTPEPAEIDDDAPPTKRKRQFAHAANRPSRSEKRGNTGGALRPPDGVSKKRRADRRFTTTSGRRSMSVDSQEQADDELFTDIGDRNQLNRTRRTSHVVQQEYGYDIDNIVIPYGMMSSTRLVERLKYKEILTPKWRILHIGAPESELTNDEQSAQVGGDATETEKVASLPSGNSSFAMEDEDTVLAVKDQEIEEDTSDAAFESRHGRQETLERQRFSVYLQPKLVANVGSPSAVTRSIRTRTESTDVQKSKELSTQTTAPSQTAMRAKDIHDESSLFGSEIGGKSDSTAKLHASKAKRQHRSLSQDWTMQQSSSAPTPYPPRSFPLSDEEFENMLQENPDPDEVEKGCETVSVDESSSQKAKDKPRKSILKVASQISATDEKQDDSLGSKTFPGQQQQAQRKLEKQETQLHEPLQQDRSSGHDEDPSLQDNVKIEPDEIKRPAGNAESPDAEDNSDDKLTSNKSEQNEDFDMADDNSNSNPSNHGRVHWLDVSCDKINEADILDEIANPEWSADEDETEPED